MTGHVADGLAVITDSRLGSPVTQQSSAKLQVRQKNRGNAKHIPAKQSRTIAAPDSARGWTGMASGSAERMEKGLKMLCL
jgi:predicted restriction endonuclease